MGLWAQRLGGIGACHRTYPALVGQDLTMIGGNKMSFSHSGLIAVSLLAAVFGLSSCQQEGTAEKAGKKIDKAVEKVEEKSSEAGKAMEEKAEKAGVYIDDSAITAQIKAEILSDPLLKVSQINVTTTNGVVRLSGVVDTPQRMDRATEIARSVKHVKSVESHLIVEGAK
jgi:hyperosmotically inducible protein